MRPLHSCGLGDLRPQQPQALQQLRQSLRERVLESPLTDYPEFTRALEDLYRQMLQQQAN